MIRASLILFVVMLVAAGALLVYSGTVPKSVGEAKELAGALVSPQTRSLALYEVRRGLYAGLTYAGTLHPSVDSFVQESVLPRLGALPSKTDLIASLAYQGVDAPTTKRFALDEYQFGFLYPHTYVVSEEGVSTTTGQVVRLTLRDVERLPQPGEENLSPHMVLIITEPRPAETPLIDWVEQTIREIDIDPTVHILSELTINGTKGITFEWGAGGERAARAVIMEGPSHMFAYLVYGDSLEDSIFSDFSELMRTTRSGVPRRE